MTEEEIIFEEFEDDLHEHIAEDIDRPHPHMGVVVNDYHDKLMHDIGYFTSLMKQPQITDRADEKVHNPSTTGNNMSDPREGEEDEPAMDDYEDEPPIDEEDEPPIDEESSITSQSTGQNNKEEQV